MLLPRTKLSRPDNNAIYRRAICDKEYGDIKLATMDKDGLNDFKLLHKERVAFSTRDG